MIIFVYLYSGLPERQDTNWRRRDTVGKLGLQSRELEKHHLSLSGCDIPTPL